MILKTGGQIGNGRQERLHSDKLGSGAKHKQHWEEGNWPEGGVGHHSQPLGVHLESQSGSARGHMLNIDATFTGHETQKGKYGETGEKTGKWIDKREYDSIAVAVVIILVVTPQGGQGAQTDCIAEENLRAGVDPHLIWFRLEIWLTQSYLSFEKFWEIWLQIEFNAINSAG